MGCQEFETSQCAVAAVSLSEAWWGGGGQPLQLLPQVARRLPNYYPCHPPARVSQGRVVEAGSHSELLAAGGKYAELWARQQAHVDEVYDSGSEELPNEEEGAAGTAGTAGPAAAGPAAAAPSPATGLGLQHGSVRRDSSGGPAERALDATGDVSPAARGGAGLGGDVPSGTS